MSARPLLRVLVALFLLVEPCPAADEVKPAAASPASQDAAPRAEAAKTIIDLQPLRRATRIAVERYGGRQGTAELIELDPRINAWFLLTLDGGEPGGPRTYHLENPRPGSQTLVLSERFPQGLALRANGQELRCDLWGAAPMTGLDRARRSALPYAPLCEGRLYLRNVVAGTYTQIERTTNFLRDYVWGGDQIVTFVREQLFQDAYLEKGTRRGGSDPALADAQAVDAPRPAPLNPAFAGHSIAPEHLAIDLGAVGRELQPGRWYPAQGVAAVFVSLMQPEALPVELLGADRGFVNRLDAVESSALDYLVAFDLNAFELGFALGTDHPRVGWSERTLPRMRDGRIPGPDGIGATAPLARTGMVSPALTGATAASFTGGFKRQHGAFRYGKLAQQNAGSHYGFIEQGVVFSKLQPDLATLYVMDDGTVGMKTWTAPDDALLPRIRHARQNGVALIEQDPVSGISSPAPLVASWGAGNWSGSADEKLRTLRAGACLQETANRRFLIYGYFSTATPSAMARVFQAYGCRYAMHLDMNALEHTYLAVYAHEADRLVVQHLIDGMAEVDKKGGDALAPRFIGFPDDRDFFYLVRKSGP